MFAWLVVHLLVLLLDNRRNKRSRSIAIIVDPRFIRVLISFNFLLPEETDMVSRAPLSCELVLVDTNVLEALVFVEIC